MIDAAGNAYVSDPGNQRIQRWHIVSTTAGTIQSATFIGWSGGCTSGSNCDLPNQRSNAFACTAATCSTPIQGSGAGQFINPGGLALDASGGLYVTDTINNRIQQFSSAGTFVRAFGTRGMGNGEFRTPVDVAVSPNTDVYVADVRNERIQRFSATGVFKTIFGGSIALTATTGFPPRPLDSLVDPNPLFIFPGQTATTEVSVLSLSSFQGSATLDTNGCCLDLVTGAYLPGAVTTSFAPSTVAVATNSPGLSTLSMTAPGMLVSGEAGRAAQCGKHGAWRQRPRRDRRRGPRAHSRRPRHHLGMHRRHGRRLDRRHGLRASLKRLPLSERHDDGLCLQDGVADENLLRDRRGERDRAGRLAHHHQQGDDAAASGSGLGDPHQPDVVGQGTPIGQLRQLPGGVADGRLRTGQSGSFLISKADTTTLVLSRGVLPIPVHRVLRQQRL